LFPTGTETQVTLVGNAETAARADTPCRTHNAKIPLNIQVLTTLGLSQGPPIRGRGEAAEARESAVETKAEISKEAGTICMKDPVKLTAYGGTQVYEDISLKPILGRSVAKPRRNPAISKMQFSSFEMARLEFLNRAR
jgi:hypothetical protein